MPTYGPGVTAVIDVNGRSLQSLYYLYPFPEQRIKVRITYPDGQRTPEAVQEFVDALLRELMAMGTAR